MVLTVIELNDNELPGLSKQLFNPPEKDEN